MKNKIKTETDEPFERNMSGSSSGQDVGFSSQKQDFDYPTRYYNYY